MNLWCSANLAEQPNIGDWPLLAYHPIDGAPDWSERRFCLFDGCSLWSV